MLIPIGHDQTTVRRMPWVTFSIIGLCLAVFIYTLIAPGDEEAVLEAEIRAVEYFIAHPYLEIDPQLKGFRYYSLRQSLGDDPAAPPGAGEVRTEQETLDGLATEYFSARNRLPFWRWGLVPADMKAVNLVTHTFIHVGFLQHGSLRDPRRAGLLAPTLLGSRDSELPERRGSSRPARAG